MHNSDFICGIQTRQSSKTLLHLFYAKTILDVDHMCSLICPFYKDKKCTTHDSKGQYCMDLDCAIQKAQWDAYKHIKDIENYDAHICF